MPKIQVNGIDLFYDIQGTGEPLLLVAGLSCDSSYWSEVMRTPLWGGSSGALLVEQYQVIRFDNRGVGQSSTPPGPYNIKQMAADAAAVLTHLGINKVHVAGHSMGGQIAQEFALAYPEKVQTLILLSSWAKGDVKFQAVIETFGDLPYVLDTRLYAKVVMSWMYTDAFYSTPEAVEQTLDMLLEYPFIPTPHAIYHQTRAILATNTLDRLSEIRCPTLIVVGKQDILTPVKFSEQLTQGIPNAELVVLDRGGHGFLVEFADAVATVMLNFLRKHSKPTLTV